MYGLFDPRKPIVIHNVRYIGKTVQKKLRYRLSHHIADANAGGTTSKDDWIRTLQAEGIKPVIHALEIVPEEIWRERETFWIAWAHDQGWDITNESPGGNGSNYYHGGGWPKGVPKPPELRARLSAANMGKPNYWKGKTRPQEQRDKVSLGLKAHFAANPIEPGSRVLSEETKRKISETLKNDPTHRDRAIYASQCALEAKHRREAEAATAQ